MGQVCILGGVPVAGIILGASLKTQGSESSRRIQVQVQRAWSFETRSWTPKPRALVVVESVD